MANSATSVANPLVQQANTATAATGTTTPATTSATGTTNATGATSTGANTATSTTPSSAQNWYNPDAIHAQMAKNGAAYAATNDPNLRNQLHQQNLNLAAQLGGKFDPNTGTYSYGTQGPSLQTPLPAAYQSGTAPAAWKGIDGQIKAGEGTDTLSNNGNSINATIYQGTSYATAKDVAQIFGGSYKQDPTTGAITINGQTVQPTGYDKAGNPIVNVKQALAAMGYDQNQIKWDNNSRTVTVQGSPQQQQQSTYNDPLAGIMGQMPGMPQLQPYQQPDLSSYYNNLVPYQTTFNPDWNSYYNQAQAQQDPLTQNSINTLMNKQGMDINKADEGMNAKGIFNSGIAVAAENQIRANTNDQVAKVIINANSQIAKTAQTLYQDAEKQWSDGNHLALQNNQMWLTQAMNQQKQSFQQWLSTQQLTMQQANYALSAWDKMAQLALTDASNQMKANQFSQTQAWDQYKFNNLSADQSATIAQKQYEFSHLSADQQAQLAWKYFQFNNLSADQNATLAQKQYQFDNLSAQQKSQLAWAQYQYDHLSANQQATQQNAADKLKLQYYDMMGYDQNGVPTLKRDQLTQTIAHDTDLMTNARQQTENTANAQMVTAMNDELTQVDKGITDITNRWGTKPPDAGSADETNLKDLMNRRNALLDQLGQYTDKGMMGGGGGGTIDTTGHPGDGGNFPTGGQ